MLSQLFQEEWRAWRETITALVTPPVMAGLRSDYPMFIISEGFSSDTRAPQVSDECPLS